MVSMTATEVRDRLDDRFRLLVGSRRGLERHQTLRHAVQWSYDLLDDDEKALLQRLLGVRRRIRPGRRVRGRRCRRRVRHPGPARRPGAQVALVADRSSGRTRFSMLETIRQFAEEQLAASGEADEIRAAHARYFAAQEPDVMALWDSPRQQEAYTWFTLEVANLRAAFRWAADHGDLESAAAIAICATNLGTWVEQFEPASWAADSSNPHVWSNTGGWRSSM